jgi:hypothetical protein
LKDPILPGKLVMLKVAKQISANLIVRQELLRDSGVFGGDEADLAQNPQRTRGYVL